MYDVSEISTPVADQNDIRTILSYANKYQMSLRQLDIKSAFLHGELEKPVYMAIPQGSNLDPALRQSHVFLLHKSMYRMV